MDCTSHGMLPPDITKRHDCAGFLEDTLSAPSGKILLVGFGNNSAKSYDT